MFIPVTRAARLALASSLLMGSACGPAPVEEEHAEEVEALSRTEFTDRVENFFEYDPLHAGQPSQFLIHLTDLEDGTPVASAQVDLRVRNASGVEVVSVRAQIGRVTGIYVAELTIANPATYAIEFEIENDKLNETMLLNGFQVE